MVCGLWFAACAARAFFAYGAVLASAFRFWFAGVAPVRGGTYFLCRRKESKQRKRTHTASPCSYPRAPDVPALHAATLLSSIVASAFDKRLTHSNHFFKGPRQRTAGAPLRQTVCRFSCREAQCSCQKNILCPDLRGATTDTQFAARGRDGLVRLAVLRAHEAGEARIQSAGS